HLMNNTGTGYSLDQFGYGMINPEYNEYTDYGGGDPDTAWCDPIPYGYLREALDNWPGQPTSKTAAAKDRFASASDSSVTAAATTRWVLLKDGTLLTDDSGIYGTHAQLCKDNGVKFNQIADLGVGDTSLMDEMGGWYGDNLNALL